MIKNKSRAVHESYEKNKKIFLTRQYIHAHTEGLNVRVAAKIR